MKLQNIFKHLHENESLFEQENNDGDNDLNTPLIQYIPQIWSNAIKIVITKWLSETPGLSQQDIDESINFFNQRKGNFRPFLGTIDSPDPNNPPEITSFKQRFPNFPSEDVNILKDITKYSWEQIEFLIERLSEERDITTIDDELDGITFEEQLKSAISIWERFPNTQKIVNENNVILIRVESKEEAIALGKVQHVLSQEYGGNIWCITHYTKTSGTNLYNKYRHDKSFYFILDRNKPIDSKEYVAAIYMYSNFTDDQSSYSITRRNNSPSFESGFSWTDLSDIWPELENKKRFVVPFPTTKKERISISLDAVNFTQGSTNDLAIQSKQIQRTYIESNRIIPSTRTFLSLPKELQTSYIAHTTIHDFKHRFICKDSSDSFKLINVIRKIPAHFKFLHENVLKTQLKIKGGTYSIMAHLLKTDLIPDFISDEGNIRMFKSKHNYFGVINIENLEWIKPCEYFREKYKLYTNKGKTYVVFKHISLQQSDNFYWVIPYEQVASKKPKGTYFSKEGGEDFIGNSTSLM